VVGFKDGLSNKTQWVFWVCTVVSEACCGLT